MMPPWEKGTCDMDSICITLKAVHNQLAAQERWPGVSGQVKSYSVAFELATPDWDGLSVTAVFTDGTESKDVLGIKAGEAVPVPHECMATVGRTVSVALYGTDSSGVVLNTGYVRLFRTGAGADPAGDTSADPTLPVWAQIQGQIGDLDELDTEDKSSLVAAINEAAQSGGGGAGGTTDHSKLKNRGAADQHPIGAITGLETALAEKYSAENPPPSGSDASLGITSATVGQIAKITAVDDSGVPTAWEPVDMPSGGGGETWEKIAEVELTDAANNVIISTDSAGAPFRLKRVMVDCVIVLNAEDPFTWIKTLINGFVASGNVNPQAASNSPRYYAFYAEIIPGSGALCWQSCSGYNYNWGGDVLKMGYKYNALWQSDAITSLTISPNDGRKNLGLAGTKIQVLGVRA